MQHNVKTEIEIPIISNKIWNIYLYNNHTYVLHLNHTFKHIGSDLSTLDVNHPPNASF